MKRSPLMNPLLSLFCAILTLFFFSGCTSSDSSEKEKALIEKEKELLSRERELLKQEKETLKDEKAKAVKPRVAPDSSIQMIVDPSDRGVRPGIVRGNGRSKDVTIEDIEQDLLGKKVQYVKKGLINVPRGWEFAALSEFISADIESQTVKSDYLEKTITFYLQDLHNGQKSYARMFITYTKYSDGWVMERYDLLSFTELK